MLLRDVPWLTPLPAAAPACPPHPRRLLAVLVMPQKPDSIQELDAGYVQAVYEQESNISVLMCTAPQFADLKLNRDAVCAPEMDAPGCIAHPVQIGERTSISRALAGRCYFLVRVCTHNIPVGASLFRPPSSCMSCHVL